MNRLDSYHIDWGGGGSSIGRSGCLIKWKFVFSQIARAWLYNVKVGGSGNSGPLRVPSPISSDRLIRR